MSSQDDYEPSQNIAGTIPRLHLRKKRKAVLKMEASGAMTRLFSAGGALDSQTTESQYLAALDPPTPNTVSEHEDENADAVCGECSVWEGRLDQLQKDFDELLRDYCGVREELTQAQVQRQGAIAENLELNLEVFKCRQSANESRQRAEELHQRLLRIYGAIPMFDEDVPEPGTSQGPEWWDQVAYTPVNDDNNSGEDPSDSTEE